MRILLPQGGVSLLDAPGKPFHDPEADNALFEALEKTMRQNARRRIERIDANINDENSLQPWWTLSRRSPPDAKGEPDASDRARRPSSPSCRR